MRRSEGASGVVLLLIASLVVLFLLLGFLFLRVAEAMRGRSAATLASARASLCAASGMDLVAARLIRDAWPRYASSRSGRADDWTCRDPVETPPDRLRNPSYDRGEPWIDSLLLAGNGADDDRDGEADEADEGHGIWTSGEAWLDLDGNGRRDAWSGRLREGGTGDLRFTLRISSLDGRIPLNAGYVDPFRHADTFPIATCHPFQLGLIHALNNLGALALPSGSMKRKGLASAPGGHLFLLSWLGTDLISHRPVGGYRSEGEVRSALLGLGYGGEDCDAVLPYLDLGPHDWQAGGGRAVPFTRGWPNPSWLSYLLEAAQVPWDPPAYAPVHLFGAPRPVLEALWMYLSSTPSYVPGVVNDWLAVSSYAGGSLPFSGIRMNLHSDEAGRLADLGARLRRSGPTDWWTFRDRMVAEAAQIFSVDAADLAAVDPRNLRTWTQAKADLAFQAVAQDPYPFFPGEGPSRTWEGWGIDRDPAPGLQQGNAVPFSEIFRIPYPAGAASAWPFDPRTSSGDRIAPLGLSLAPPVRFQAESAAASGGASATLAGSLRTAQRIDFSTQEDFENLTGGVIRRTLQAPVVPEPLFRVADRLAEGIQVFEPSDPRLRFDVRPETVPEARLDYPHVVSRPRWSQRTFMKPPGWEAVPDGKDNDGDGQTDEPGELNADGVSNNQLGLADEAGEQNGVFGPSRCYGAVTLATVERGLRGARLYQPLSMRLDHALPNDLAFEKDPLAVGIGLPSVPPLLYPLDLGRLPDVALLQGLAMMWPTKIVVTSDIGGGSHISISEASVEGWISPEGVTGGTTLSLASTTAAADRILVELKRGTVPDQRTLRLGLLISWSVQDWDKVVAAPGFSAYPKKSNAGWLYWTFREDQIPGPAGLAAYHVVLTLKRVDDGLFLPWTEARVWLNGVNVDPAGAQMKAELLRGYSAPGHVVAPEYRGGIGLKASGAAGATVRLSARGDELRFHAAIVDPAARFSEEKERFHRSGTFRSPLYVQDSTGRVRWVQATGLVPTGLPASALRVWLEGFRDSWGASQAWLAEVPLTGALDLSALPPARSFRYRVGFRSTDPAPMADTPVFESLSLTLMGNGRTPSWMTWGSR